MNTQALSQLTTLLAAHGVYALTILFIFFQQRRTYSDFKNATDKTRPFLQTIYKSSVVATYALALLSTIAWGYSTFRRPPYLWVDGAIDDIKNEVVQPITPRDPPSIVQTIEPDSSSLNRFMTERVDCDPATGTCQLRFALKTRSDLASLGFKFRHTYMIARLAPSASDPNERVEGTVFDRNTVGNRFRLDPSTMDINAGRELSLRYEQNKDTTKIGTLYALAADQQWVAVPWDTLPAEPARTALPDSVDWRLSLARFWTVWADGGKNPFGPRGEYQDDFGRNLRAWLGGPTLPLQQRGVQIVVDGRERAFRFMIDSQAAALGPGTNRSVLTSNLVRASEEIEALGRSLPRDLVVSLAVASSQGGSYETSARLFDKVGRQPLPKTESYFYRGLAYRETRRYKAAIDDLQRYAKEVPSAYSKAVAYTSIGICYRRSNDTEKAAQSYRLAIRTYPNYAGPYNSLAYLQALDPKRTDFTEALRLVDKALQLRPDDPNYLDTKGWVLYRMRRYAEAKAALEIAYRELPGDEDVEGHLMEVRKAIGQSIQRGR